MLLKLQLLARKNTNVFCVFAASSNVSTAEEMDNFSQTNSEQSRPQRGISQVVGHEYDLLDDIDTHKDVYRLKVGYLN